MKPRNIFIVANNVDEIGGVQRLVYVYADMFTKAGHNVEVIGITNAVNPHTFVVDPPYRVTVAYQRPPAVGGGEERPPAPTDTDGGDEAERRRLTVVERLAERFATVEQGVVIVMQVWAMQWVQQVPHDHLHIIGQSHESYEASRAPTNNGRVTRYKRLMRHYPDIDLALFLTRDDAEKYETDGLNNVGVMENPLPFYPDEPAALDAKTIVTVGRYAPEKDQPRLIDAFKLVHAIHPDWMLRLVGDGPMAEVLQEKVRHEGLEDFVDVAGPTTDVVGTLMSSSIFALSSENEGLPVVLAEAMACGVPCVTVDCSPGVRELIEDGVDGIIVPQRDTQALADGLCRLIEDESLRRRLAQAARRSIARLTPDHILAQWHDVFDYVER